MRLVQCRRTKRFYALKYMAKTLPIKKRRIMVQERNVLAQLQHPLLCNMQFAFQDNLHLYMVLDIMSGGDLRYYLRRYTLSEEAIRDIVSEIACAVEYVHEQSLVHRDVKPDNILLDERGHAHLCDFNIAARLTCEEPLLSGVSGTFNYLAPEMQAKCKYGEQVDWWALGVVLYESLYGRVPFRGKSRQEMVYEMERGPQFPPTQDPAVTPEATAAAKAFLKVLPSERIRTCDDVWRLEFFKGITRQKVEQDYLEGKPGPVGFRSADILDCRNDVRVNAVAAMKHDVDHWDSKANSTQYIARGTGPSVATPLMRLRQKLRDLKLGIAECASRRDQPDHMGMYDDATMAGSGPMCACPDWRDESTEVDGYSAEYRTFITPPEYYNNASDNTLVSPSTPTSKVFGFGGVKFSTTTNSSSSNNTKESTSCSALSRCGSHSTTNISLTLSSNSDGPEYKPQEGMGQGAQMYPRGIIAIGRAGRGARHVVAN